MRGQTFRKFWPAAALATLLLAGCSGSGDHSASTAAEPEAAKAATGTVNIAVQFPTESLRKALIDSRTTSITVAWQDASNGYQLGSVELTPDPTTGLAQAQIEVPVGEVYFTATAYESVSDPYDPMMTVQKDLERVSTAGKIASGTNSVILSFIAGDWQFVDANDNPQPLTVGSGASSRTLAGFMLASTHSNYYPAAAKIDPSKPAGWGEYALQWYAAGATPAPLGPQLEAEQESQFDGATAANNNSFWGEWLNLTSPAASEGIGSESAVPSFPQTGDRMLLILDYMDAGSNESISDAAGNDMLPALDAYADSQVFDGTHITGHLLEMTAESLTRTLVSANIDCAPYRDDYGPYYPAMGQAAAIRSQLAGLQPMARRAAPGDASTLYAGTITVTSQECYEQPWQTDGDGDGDYVSDYLYDANGNGLYDAGELYEDYNGDGHYDWTVENRVDGDGDGDLTYEYLTKDVNFNGRYDAADGDTFEDYDNDGNFDYYYHPGDLYTETEQFSNLVVREFRAKGSQNLSAFTPPLAGGWNVSTTSDESTVITFLDATTYIMAEDGMVDLDPVTGAFLGGPGIEYGTYTFDRSTGTLTATAIANTNGDWGPAGNDTDTLVLSFNNLNSLTATDPNDPAGSPTLMRLIGDWPPFIGSWKIGDAQNGLQVISFLPGNTYMVASYSGSGTTVATGMERGSYNLEEISEGKFILNATGVNSTLPAGDAAVCAPMDSASIQIELNGNTMKWTDTDGTATLTRVN